MRFLAYKFVDRLIDFIFRRRSIEAHLIKYGASIAIAAMGFSYFFKLTYHGKNHDLSVQASTGDGPATWIIDFAFFTGLGMCLVGLLIATHKIYREMRTESRRKIIIVELRGLQSSPDTPATEVVLKDIRGQRTRIELDFRVRTATGTTVTPEAALAKLSTMMHAVEVNSAGKDKSDVSVVVGGLAPVPLLFLAGLMLDDESNITVIDWDRNLKEWRVADGPDDGKRFLPIEIPSICGEAAVLAVAISYPISDDAIRQSFGEAVPIFRLTAEEVLSDRHWSEHKQAAFAAAFREAVQRLMNAGVKRIHLILAAPASQAIRIGMAYDKRLMPEIVVYQYEKSMEPPYPWGIQMPTHGITTALVTKVP